MKRTLPFFLAAALLSGCAAPPVVSVAERADFRPLDAKIVRARKLNETADQRADRIQRLIAQDKEIIDRK